MRCLVLGVCWKKRRLLHRHGKIELNSNDAACDAKGHKTKKKASVDFFNLSSELWKLHMFQSPCPRGKVCTY